MRFSRDQNTKKIQTQRNREKKKEADLTEALCACSSLEICIFIQESVHPDHNIALRAREHSEAGEFSRLVAAWFAGFWAIGRGVCRASGAGHAQRAGREEAGRARDERRERRE